MLGMLMAPTLLWAAPFPGPFFRSGDGTLALQARQGGVVRVTYRRGGGYDDAALQRLNGVFGAPWHTPTERISLRLIELLDHVQDHFGGATIVLRSGYRSPVDNARLRALGKLAAQSSLHMEGDAIDCHLQGVRSADVAEYVQGLGCCGVGFYHGQEVHLDVGPARWWDEATSGTEGREPQENAKIMLATDRDRYRAGETVTLRFQRITAYPVLAPATLTLEWRPRIADETEPWHAAAATALYHQQPLPCAGPQCGGVAACVPLANRAQAKSVQWVAGVPRMPAEPVRARLTAHFCRRVSDKMPATIASNEFEIWLTSGAPPGDSGRSHTSY